MRRKVIVGFGVVALGAAFLVFGTWRCMSWMVDCRMGEAKGTLWASETWPKLLNLTNDQRAQLKPLEDSLQADLNRVQTELAHKQISLCGLMMSSDIPDRKALDAALGKISILQLEKEKKTLSHLLALGQILTPHQKKMLFSTMMQDICLECRTTTGHGKDMCGMCAIPHGKPQ